MNIAILPIKGVHAGTVVADGAFKKCDMEEDEIIEHIVRVMPAALDDIDELYWYIAGELFSPVTADKYVDGLYNIIDSLSWLGALIAVSQNEYIQKRYGPEARTVAYKKMTIIYNVVDTFVLVQRIMASRLIQ